MEKSITKLFVIILSLVFCLTSIGAEPSDTEKSKTLASLQKMGDLPLYTMEYYADYAFDEYLKEGSKDYHELIQFLLKHHLISDNNILNKPQKLGCTSFMARNSQNEILYGRNDDWPGDKSIPMLLTTHPSDGYASISIMRLNDLKGNSGDNGKDTEAIWSNIFAAPYILKDGMNEYGVTVSILSVPDRGGSETDPGKVTITGISAMRLILDYAKNLDEAIALLHKYNLRFGGSHYLIADAAGNSAIVEVIDGKLQIIKNVPMPWPNQKKSWQVASNFLLFNGIGGGHDRYSTAVQTLLNKQGLLSETEAMELLRSVSQYSKESPLIRARTIWSTVYNLNTKELNLVLERQYDKVMKFKLIR